MSQPPSNALLPEMSDRDEQSENPASLTETLVSLQAGVPVQVQRNFWKAVARVFTASAEVPAAWLVGKAELIRTRHDVQAADLRSRQRARELVETGSAEAAAKQFQKPELAERALNYHAAHIMREQENREAVLQIAADELTKNPPASEQTIEVNDDWLTVFFQEASTRSSKDFRILFGRILAGEIKQPGTFSFGTIQSVGRLDQTVACIFEKACNVSSVLPGGGRPKIIADPFGEADENALEPFGLNYDNLAVLVETGLLRHELNEWRDLCKVYYTHRFVFDHAGQSFYLSEESGDTKPVPSLLPTLRLTGPSFSQARGRAA